jgi:calcineurin-like phosphoesterase
MRLLFLGDVVGRSGRQAVTDQLPKLRQRYKLDFVVVNGENSAGGFGITENIFEDLLGAGADVVTLGNHAFDQKEALVFIERQPRLLRPINYPSGTPGKASACSEPKTVPTCCFINAMGLIFMPELGDPSGRWSAGGGLRPEKGSDAIWSIFMPRRPARSRRWATSSTGVPPAWWAPYPRADRR